MTDAGDRLAMLWTRDEPPAADPAFRLAVMETVARRRFQRSLRRIAALAAVSAVMLGAAAPFIEAAAVSLAGTVDLNLAGIMVAAGLTFWLARPLAWGGKAR